MIYSKTLYITKIQLLKTVQITHRSQGKQKNEKQRGQTEHKKIKQIPT